MWVLHTSLALCGETDTLATKTTNYRSTEIFGVVLFVRMHIEFRTKHVYCNKNTLL